MSFYKKIKYFLVHSLSYTNKEAQQLLDGGHVEIDGLKTSHNCILADESEVKVNGKIARPKKTFIYLKFFKPIGNQSSLNPMVTDSLADFFTDYPDLAIAGRLDKMSEGLLVLSNDGKWIEKMCNPKFEKEKEYLVTLDKEPDATFLDTFRKGVIIGNYITQPCRCIIIAGNAINVVLKEGKNRQIRRMCGVLGYRVMKLKRLRIGGVHLNNMQAGELEAFSVD